ncbi:MAG: glycosyltransferase family 4 protein [Solirubrobacterales bacterium]
MANQLAAGGAERTILQLCQHLPVHGIRCTVFSFYGSDLLLPELETTGADFVPMNVGRTYWRGLRKLRGELARRQIDVLNTHLPYASAVGRLAAKAAAVPCVSTQQCIHSAHARSERIADILTLPLANHVVCISEAVRDEIIAAEPIPLSARTSVIYNSVDIADISRRAQGHERIRSRLGISPDAVVIANVGRFTRQKGQDLLIEALGLLDRDLPVHAVIVGWGSDGDQLQGLADRLGVAGKVTLLREPAAAMQVLASADVFAFPSRWEGLGIAVLEAMAFSLPCVVPRTRPLTEMIVDREHGLHFKAESSEDLAAALSRLIRDPELRGELGRRGRTDIERFSSERMAREYAAILRSAATARIAA